ncbi:MAG: PLDc N-terminal domain-containing protein [Gemmataceae bacterium]|nr:PLDc N-terminal domain-containing protein [Gemmataceae bacterium]
MTFAITGPLGASIQPCLFGIAVGAAVLAFWVLRDARKRDLGESAGIWVVVVVGFPLIGLVVYLCCRPNGRMAWCPRCHRELLAALTQCPHCGHQPSGTILR